MGKPWRFVADPTLPLMVGLEPFGIESRMAPKDWKRQSRLAVVSARFPALPFEGCEHGSGSLWHTAADVEAVSVVGGIRRNPL